MPKGGGSQPAVRFGGFRGPDGYVFEITGGHLCLDLANTLDNRPTAQPRELLQSIQDLVSWGVQAGAISSRIGLKLRREASRDPLGARRALLRAREIRENIFLVFAAVTERRAPPRNALERLDAAISKAISTRRLTPEGGRLVWEWPDAGPLPLDRVLWPALISAGELLTSGDADRVRKCEGERCAWLFLDRSKNRSRRWCDMTVCGNRVKARRHYERTKGEGNSH